MADDRLNFKRAMYCWNLENERLEAETYLCGRRRDFTTTYMRVANLQYIICQQPEIVRESTVAALCQVLEGTEHIRQRQVFFLFKKAADALAAIVSEPTPDESAARACRALSRLLSARTGHPFRAVAEAMGSLPLVTACPDPDFSKDETIPVLELPDLTTLLQGPLPQNCYWAGRSLIMEDPLAPEHRRIVIKFARPGQPNAELAAEACWMQYLGGLSLPEGERLTVPEPLSDKSPLVLQITDKRIAAAAGPDIDPDRHAVCFRVHRDYFNYPNHPRNNGGQGEAQDPMISRTACRRILSHNARLFGLLAARGIVHTAPIPLFHNRVQRHRREDRGLYEWRRGGRLDQWLASCRYPNISGSGPRDFEHFIAFDGPARRLYEHIGSHVFSLVLIAGSYCRNHDPARVGLDASGEPVDARDLFDPAWLKQVLRDVFNSYYEGFTGRPPTGSPPCDMEGLCSRLIEEMGVDRHMEEILRVAEQQAMTRDEFEAFLAARGFSRQAIAALEKGRQDIQILTGPHLGGFNQRISVPELTEYAAALAALCIMDRYLSQRQRAGQQPPRLLPPGCGEL